MIKIISDYYAECNYCHSTMKYPEDYYESFAGLMVRESGFEALQTVAKDTGWIIERNQPVKCKDCKENEQA